MLHGGSLETNAEKKSECKMIIRNQPYEQNEGQLLKLIGVLILLLISEYCFAN